MPTLPGPSLIVCAITTTVNRLSSGLNNPHVFRISASRWLLLNPMPELSRSILERAPPCRMHGMRAQSVPAWKTVEKVPSSVSSKISLTMVFTMSIPPIVSSSSGFALML